jgi:site-specific DNA recombinase
MPLKICPLSKVDDILMAYITTAAKVLRDLPNYYQRSTLSTKKKLIGSMYTEKLVYENKSYQTTRINEAARVICNPDGLLEEFKKGQASEIGSLSEQVTRIGFEPMTPSPACRQTG